MMNEGLGTARCRAHGKIMRLPKASKRQGRYFILTTFALRAFP